MACLRAKKVLAYTGAEFIFGERLMTKGFRLVSSALVVAGFLWAGSLSGAWQAHRAVAQNRFGQPKTVIHVVLYKWKDGVSDADKQKAIAGIKEMAAKIPGVKNVWLKATRLQLRDLSGAFVIEFASPEAAADYAENPIHEAWSKSWQQLRENSLSFQVTNGD
jgi:hypothetical protein